MDDGSDPEGAGGLRRREVSRSGAEPRPYLDARDAFMYLVLFSTLYWSAYHLGSLLFDIINVTFPDPATDQVAFLPYARSAMRWSISSLIVAFPVFLYMSWLVARDIAADPNKRHSKVRRWLTYLTLFFASSLIIGDVITLLYNLLGGEITIRFRPESAGRRVHRRHDVLDY